MLCEVPVTLEGEQLLRIETHDPALLYRCELAVLTIKTQGRRFSSVFQSHGDFYAPSSSARCPSGAWMRRACWRSWRRTTLQRQPIIWTMMSGTRHKWLVKWSGSGLPDGPQRRRKWDDRVKEHARLVAAAARAVASPASMPRRKGARKPPVPTPHEPMLAAREEPMQLAADMPERASPARPPEDSEDLGLPLLAAAALAAWQSAAA